ncbi:MAG TPA: histidine--tRNA ligase [Methylomirabilota bacterium]|nr:histidine--tRNA ligase [Methylomirabilota bacterium]
MADPIPKKPAKISTEPPRGMRDILPDEAELRDTTAETILGVYRRYGFRRIETPALENIQLLTRGEGGENEKLIFKVLKRGEKLDLAQATSEADLVDLGLRFDLTVPLARYYANNQARLPRPLKAVQIGPVWRAERPQKGRFRQFTQCDIDILGIRSEVAEIELILATTEALTALGLEDLTVRINDRRLLTALAAWCGFDPDRYDSAFITLDKWDKLDPTAIVEELGRAGHAPVAIQRMVQMFTKFDKGEGLEGVRQYVKDPDGAQAIDGLKRIIEAVRSASGRPIVWDETLVRGMSYYTGPIFEITSARFPSSIAGGGRYDRLIGNLLGHDVPATGFSIGFERVVAILMDRTGGIERRAKRVALVFDEATADLKPVLEEARALRAQGYDVSLELRAKRSGAQAASLREQGFDVRWFGAAVPPAGDQA